MSAAKDMQQALVEVRDAVARLRIAHRRDAAEQLGVLCSWEASCDSLQEENKELKDLLTEVWLVLQAHGPDGNFSAGYDIYMDLKCAMGEWAPEQPEED